MGLISLRLILLIAVPISESREHWRFASDSEYSDGEASICNSCDKALIRRYIYTLNEEWSRPIGAAETLEQEWANFVRVEMLRFLRQPNLRAKNIPNPPK